MKTLYNKRISRRADGERHQFAFFAACAIGILAAVFVIGLQVGRMIEKNAASTGSGPLKGAVPPPAQPAASKGAATEISKDLGAFSEEAGKVPVVPPPDAKATAYEVEKRLTFQESLPRKVDRPAPLVRAFRTDNNAVSKTGNPREAGRREYVVQAGAFRDRGAAESCRKRLEKAGYRVRVRMPDAKTGEKYHRVLLEPFASGGAARKAVRKLKSEMNIEAFILPG